MLHYIIEIIENPKECKEGRNCVLGNKNISTSSSLRNLLKGANVVNLPGRPCTKQSLEKKSWEKVAKTWV